MIGPGSGLLLSGGHDHKVIVSDIDKGSILFKIEGYHTGHVLSI